MTIAPDPPRAEPEIAPVPHVEVIGEAPLADPMRAQAIRGGASWMIWIAALSLVNVALTAGGSDMSFAIGLFVAQFIAIMGVAIGNEAHMPALVWIIAAIAAVPALAFGALWFPAKSGKSWVFVLAMIAYGLDLAFLLVLLAVTGEMDVIGIAIHAWALWALFRGWTATRQPA